jgi:DNA-binding response OmpR family regulator
MLPRSGSPGRSPQPGKPRRIAPVPATRGRKILIVEDDADLRRIYRVALVLSGFEVREAGDGLDALRQLDADPADAVILDLGLPFISGFTVREEIAAQASLRHIPVIVVTGSADSLDQLKVPCILRKPVVPEELATAVHRCLAAAKTRGPGKQQRVRHARRRPPSRPD